MDEQKNTENNGIFEVLTDLNLGGTLKKAGQFIEAHVEAFADLVEMGVLRLIEGAENVADAAKTIADEAEVKAQEAEIEKETAPKNTWEANKPEVKTDEPAAPAEEKIVPANPAEVIAPVLSKYTIVAEEGIPTANGETLAKDTVVELDPADQSTIDLLATGSIELVPVTSPDEETGDNL